MFALFGNIITNYIHYVLGYPIFIQQKLHLAKVLAHALKGIILNVLVNTWHSMKPLTDETNTTPKGKQ